MDLSTISDRELYSEVSRRTTDVTRCIVEMYSMIDRLHERYTTAKNSPKKMAELRSEMVGLHDVLSREIFERFEMKEIGEKAYSDPNIKFGRLHNSTENI